MRRAGGPAGGLGAGPARRPAPAAARGWGAGREGRGRGGRGGRPGRGRAPSHPAAAAGAGASLARGPGGGVSEAVPPPPSPARAAPIGHAPCGVVTPARAGGGAGPAGGRAAARRGPGLGGPRGAGGEEPAWPGRLEGREARPGRRGQAPERGRFRRRRLPRVPCLAARRVAAPSGSGAPGPLTRSPQPRGPPASADPSVGLALPSTPLGCDSGHPFPPLPCDSRPWAAPRGGCSSRDSPARDRSTHAPTRDPRPAPVFGASLLAKVGRTHETLPNSPTLVDAGQRGGAQRQTLSVCLNPRPHLFCLSLLSPLQCLDISTGLPF